MTAHEILHIIRNPWGWSEEEVRQARIAAAYLIEQQAAELAILKQRNPNGQRNPSEGDPCGRSCEGQAYRIELRQARAKNEQQAKDIESLRALLNDIKLFEVDSGVERMKKGEPAFAMPVELRKRIQSALTGQ
jgi:hypothetical protein